MVSRVGFRWTWQGEGRRLCAGVALRGCGSCGQAEHGGFRGSVSRVTGGRLRRRIKDNQSLAAIFALGLHRFFQVICLSYQPCRVHEIKLGLMKIRAESFHARSPATLLKANRWLKAEAANSRVSPRHWNLVFTQNRG
jgi:hypothetical protein